MKVKYDANSKLLILDNEDFMLIPLKQNAVGIQLDSTVFKFNDDTGVQLSFENFYINGKPIFKHKLKLIWYILTMKKEKKYNY